MFFEKATTLTLTDICSCSNISQSDFFRVMFLNVHQNIFQTIGMLRFTVSGTACLMGKWFHRNIQIWVSRHCNSIS